MSETSVGKGVLTVEADTSKLGDQIDKGVGDAAKRANDRLAKTGDELTNYGKKGLLATAGLATGLFGLASAASDLGETISASEVIFGDGASAVAKFGDEAARSAGLSKQAAIDGANTLGTFGKAAGLAGADLATFSTDLVQLAGDLASFKNTSPEQAIEAIGAALRGESEPIRAYGVLLDDATLKQRAMEMGIYDGNGALSAQQKILAASQEIFAQTTDAQGDFERTSDSMANQVRILKAEAMNLAASFGESVLPAAKDLLGIGLSLVGMFNDLPGPVKTVIGQTLVFGTAIGGAASGALYLAGKITGLVSSFRGLASGSLAAKSALAGVAFVGTAAVLTYAAIADEKAQAKAITDEFAQALHDEAAGQRDALKAAIARQIADKDLIESGRELGITAADIAAAIQGKQVPAFDRLNAAVDEAKRGHAGWDLVNTRLNDSIGVGYQQVGVFLERVNDLTVSMGAATEQVAAQTEAEEALGIETDTAADSVDDLTTATNKLNPATRASATEVYGWRLEAQAADEQARALAQSLADDKMQFELLVGTLSNDKSLLNLETSFNNIETAAAEAFTAAADGSKTAEQASIDYQLEVIALKEQVAQYAREVLGLPAEQITKMLAQIDEGAYAAVESRLQFLSRNRPIVIGGQIVGSELRDLLEGRKERGGSVRAGSAYLVGEKRPEVFVPDRNGTIVPSVPQYMATTGTGGGPTVSIENAYFNNGNDAAGLASALLFKLN